MDNDSLKSIMLGGDLPTFWIKPVGIPDEEPNTKALYTQANLTVEFSRSPEDVEIGHILIVYRIGISKVIFVAECLSMPREVTSQEIERQPWKERWPWTIEVRNLTPTYGRNWANLNIKPFSLVKNFNKLYPEDPQNLGSLQFGNDKLKISPDFGAFVLRKIMRLP
jgi:hypothetical protein